MSEDRSIANSEDQQTPTFTNIEETIFHPKSLASRLTVKVISNNFPESSQSQGTVPLIQKAKSELHTNKTVISPDRLKNRGVFARKKNLQGHQRMVSNSQSVNNLSNESKNSLVGSNISRTQGNAVGKPNYSSKKEQNKKQKIGKQKKVNLCTKSPHQVINSQQNTKEKISTFWKYIVHEKDPSMKRTIIKPCRFWIGQHVQYFKAGKIIKKIRRQIAQIFINPFDHHAILSSKIDLQTENITRGFIVVKPNAKLRLNLIQRITMTISKDYSFDITEDELLIVQKKGQNRVFFSKKKAWVMKNTLSVSCEIDLKLIIHS